MIKLEVPGRLGLTIRHRIATLVRNSKGQIISVPKDAPIQLLVLPGAGDGWTGRPVLVEPVCHYAGPYLNIYHVDQLGPGLYRVRPELSAGHISLFAMLDRADAGMLWVRIADTVKGERKIVELVDGMVELRRCLRGHYLDAEGFGDDDRAAIFHLASDFPDSEWLRSGAGECPRIGG